MGTLLVNMIHTRFAIVDHFQSALYDVSRTAVEILSLKNFGVMTLTFSGHIMSFNKTKTKYRLLRVLLLSASLHRF